MAKVDIFNTDNKYNIIYADPPWKYGSKQPFRSGGVRFHSLEEEYPMVSTDQMCQWDVGRIADNDCALFMWTTDSHVEDAIKLMKAWGFKYVTIAFIWAKQTNRGNQVSNLGAWTMKNCEICLFGTKGAMKKYKYPIQFNSCFVPKERNTVKNRIVCVDSFKNYLVTFHVLNCLQDNTQMVGIVGATKQINLHRRYADNA